MPDVLIIILNVTVLALFCSSVKSFSEFTFEVVLALMPKFSILGECSTPNGQAGECIRLNFCDSLKNLIRQKPLSYQNRVFLRQSQCDYVNGYPWVCCPFDRLPQVTTRKPRTISPGNYEHQGSFLLKPGESVCGKPFRSLEDRIYGGDETMLGEFPW